MRLWKINLKNKEEINDFLIKKTLKYEWLQYQIWK